MVVPVSRATGALTRRLRPLTQGHIALAAQHQRRYVELDTGVRPQDGLPEALRWEMPRPDRSTMPPTEVYDGQDLQRDIEQSNAPTADSEARMPRAVQLAYLRPLRRTPKYRVPTCNLQLRSYSVRNLEFFTTFALRAAYFLKLPAVGPVPLPKQIERWTVPKGHFVHKKSQENFERITLRRLIQIQDGHPETIQIWLAYLQKRAYYAVGMKANVWAFDKLGLGREMDATANDATALEENWDSRYPDQLTPEVQAEVDKWLAMHSADAKYDPNLRLAELDSQKPDSESVATTAKSSQQIGEVKPLKRETSPKRTESDVTSTAAPAGIRQLSSRKIREAAPAPINASVLSEAVDSKVATQRTSSETVKNTPQSISASIPSVKADFKASTRKTQSDIHKNKPQPMSAAAKVQSILDEIEAAAKHTEQVNEEAQSRTSGTSSTKFPPAPKSKPFVKTTAQQVASGSVIEDQEQIPTSIPATTRASQQIAELVPASANADEATVVAEAVTKGQEETTTAPPLIAQETLPIAEDTPTATYSSNTTVTTTKPTLKRNRKAKTKEASPESLPLSTSSIDTAEIQVNASSESQPASTSSKETTRTPATASPSKEEPQPPAKSDIDTTKDVDTPEEADPSIEPTTEKAKEAEAEDAKGPVGGLPKTPS